MTSPDKDDDLRDDLRWLAALGGHADESSDSGEAGADDATRREAAWLRAAYQAWDPNPPVPEAQPATEAEVALLLDRGRAAGLRLPPREPGPMRRWLIGAALAATAAGLWWTQRPRPAEAPWPPEVLRGDPAVWLLRDADPRGARDRLAARLEAAGAQVLRYDRLGRHGLEAERAAALPPELLKALWQDLGVRPGVDGDLRVEVEAAP